MEVNKKEGDFMPIATIITPQQRPMVKNTRKSLEEIRLKALEKREKYSTTVYDPKEENEFFKTLEPEIYKEIVSDND